MKKVCFFILLILPVLVSGQDSLFHISGKIRKASKGSVLYLHYDRANRDSVVLKTGNFTFKGNLKEPGYAFLILKSSAGGVKENVLPFYLNREPLVVTADNTFSDVRLKGSVVNADYAKYLQRIKKSTEEINRLGELVKSVISTAEGGWFKVKEGVSDGFLDSLQNLLAQEQEKITGIQEEFIKEFSTSYFSLILLDTYAGKAPKDIAKCISLFSALDPKIQNSEKGKAVDAFFQSKVSIAVGKNVPDFMQPDRNGKAVSPSDFRGKYLLVDFWASWCLPCRASHPELVKAYDGLKGEGFEILSVSLDNDRQAWIKAIEQDNLYWNTHVSDLKGWQNAAAKLFGIKRVPFNLLVSPDGKILGQSISISEISELIEKDRKGSGKTENVIDIIGEISLTTGDVVDSVYLAYSDGRRPEQGNAPVNGKFRFQVPAEDSTAMVVLMCTYKNLSNNENLLRRFSDSRSFYLEGESIKVKIDGQFRTAQVSGGIQNIYFDKYRKEVLSHYSDKKESPEVRDHRSMAFIRSYPGSWHSVHLLYDLAERYLADGSKQDAPDSTLIVLRDLSENLSAEVNNRAEAIRNQLENSINRKVIPFTGEMPDGKTFSSESLSGRVYLIDFWGSWCVWCRKGHPHLKNLYEKYKKHGFEIIGVGHELGGTREEKWNKLKAAIKEDGISWPQILNDQASHDLVKSYLVGAFPTKILVGKDGNILLRVTSDEEGRLEKSLKGLYGF